MEIILKIEKDDKPVKLHYGEVVDLGFLTLSNMTTQNAPFYSQKMIETKLSHQLKRSPNDLKSHIQRLQIIIKQKKSAAVYAHLVELFLVLGNDGEALRARMLESARDILSKEHYDELRPSLFLGLEPTFFNEKRKIINFINKIES